ncbi:MAG: polysaccharide deacetylase family protein [Acidobacteria bacterium]|nr:polysaccharide deacetylase family protein [Acidobacteriota bacterium]
MVQLFAAIGAGLVALAHTAPFPFLIEGLQRDESAWHVRVDPAAPTVYLTYDDGPNPAATPLLLDVLARERASATFFLIDDHVTDETAPLVRRMFVEGHAVALHSNERWLMLQTPDAIADALGRAADRIAQLGGARPCPYFRPHAGWRSGALYQALDRLDYRLAGWSWGLWDWNWWRPRDAAGLAARLARRAQAGDIIVMHDGHHRNPRADRQYAVEATAQLIPALRARQFDLARLPCEGL